MSKDLKDMMKLAQHTREQREFQPIQRPNSRVYQAWLGLEILQLSPTLREVPWLQPLEKQPGIVVTAALSELYQETEGAKQKMKRF